jgi:hypothetical protein
MIRPPTSWLVKPAPANKFFSNAASLLFTSLNVSRAVSYLREYRVPNKREKSRCLASPSPKGQISYPIRFAALEKPYGKEPLANASGSDTYLAHEISALSALDS